MGFLDRLENAKGRSPKGNCLVPLLAPLVALVVLVGLVRWCRR